MEELDATFRVSLGGTSNNRPIQQKFACVVGVEKMSFFLLENLSKGQGILRVSDCDDRIAVIGGTCILSVLSHIRFSCNPVRACCVQAIDKVHEHQQGTPPRHAYPAWCVSRVVCLTLKDLRGVHVCTAVGVVEELGGGAAGLQR